VAEEHERGRDNFQTGILFANRKGGVEPEKVVRGEDGGGGLDVDELIQEAKLNWPITLDHNEG
jgi:hypothetical protein